MSESQEQSSEQSSQEAVIEALISGDEQKLKEAGGRYLSGSLSAEDVLYDFKSRQERGLDQENRHQNNGPEVIQVKNYEIDEDHDFNLDEVKAAIAEIAASEQVQAFQLSLSKCYYTNSGRLLVAEMEVDPENAHELGYDYLCFIFTVKGSYDVVFSDKTMIYMIYTRDRSTEAVELVEYKNGEWVDIEDY